MKPVSQDFIDAWHQKNGKGGFIYVKFKRRYWNGSAFVYEPDWAQFTLRDIVEVGNITWKLDTPLLNNIKSSTVILKFRNSDYQFLPSNNTSGLFAPSLAAPDGYEPFLTQFQVLFGYKKANGDIETTELFTGFAIDYLFKPKDGYCEVTVSGGEFLLQSTDARLVSSLITAGPTTLTGANQFTTGATGIAFITNVYDDGNLKVQGTDYTISGTNQFGAGAVIQLNYTAIGAITYDGRSWFTLKKIEDLVTLIAIQSNILSYNISPVIFPGGSGPVVTDIGLFSGTNYAAAWTVGANAHGIISASGGVLTISSQAQAIGPDLPSWLWTPAAPAYGIWTWRQSCTVAGVTGLGVRAYFISSSNVNGANDQPSTNGYYLEITDGGATCRLIKVTTAPAFTTLFSVSAPLTLPGGFTAEHIWTVTRGADGHFNVFADGIQIGTAIDNTFTTSTYFLAYALGAPGIGGGLNVLNISEIVNQVAIELTMADFSGLTCYDAVQKLAKLADYEWGFDSTGTMFFRNKTPTSLTPIVSIDQSDGVSEVVEFRPGYDRVKNNIQITYETYYREYNSSTLPETTPTSEQRYLSQILQEDYSEFLLAFDPVIAAGRAQSAHDNNFRAKRYIRVKSKIIPFLELSDVMGFSYYQNPRNVDNILGDPLETWGVSALGPPNNILSRNIPGKAIGMILDPNNCTGEYELQEVLS